jgi:general secretion pathway protein M
MVSLRSSFSQILSKLMEYYNRQSERDQKAIMLLGVCSALILAFNLLWLPLHDLKDRSLKDATQHFKDFMWLNDNAASLSAMANTASTKEGSGAPLLQAINEAATKHNVALANFNAEEDGQVRLSLLNAPFDKVLQFVAILEVEYGFTIADVTMTKVNDNGIINTQMTVSDGVY